MNWIKGRVLDAKTVTQLNSVRVSFVNRKENGGFFSKSASSRTGSAVGRVAWAVSARRRMGRAGVRAREGLGRAACSGPRGGNRFSNFPVNYKYLFNLVFS